MTRSSSYKETRTSFCLEEITVSSCLGNSCSGIPAQTDCKEGKNKWGFISLLLRINREDIKQKQTLKQNTKGNVVVHTCSWRRVVGIWWIQEECETDSICTTYLGWKWEKTLCSQFITTFLSRVNKKLHVTNVSTGKCFHLHRRVRKKGKKWKKIRC